MCRVLTYLGQPIAIKDLLINPDNSLFHQSYAPNYMSNMLNLAGFGMALWHNNLPQADIPLVYKTAQVPIYDHNIYSLSDKLTANCLLAHIRGVSFDVRNTLGLPNVHPFILPGSNLAFAHNGTLVGSDTIKSDLYQHIKPEIAGYLKGNTDTEMMFGILMSLLDDPYHVSDVKIVSKAVEDMLSILKDIRDQKALHITSPLNFFITNGEFLIITRFVFDYGALHPSVTLGHTAYHSLWYTFGESFGFFNDEYKMQGSQKKHSVMFCSEPLTNKVTTWIEVPEYALIEAYYEGDEINIITKNIDL